MGLVRLLVRERVDPYDGTGMLFEQVHARSHLIERLVARDERASRGTDPG